MPAFINSIALDIAGLGLLGAGAYCLVTGKGGSGAPAALLGLGGGYLGFKGAVTSGTPTPGTIVTTTAPPVVKAPVTTA